MRVTPEERFFAKVAKGPDGRCWQWTGAMSGGYGQFHFNGRVMRAHRYSYELFIGQVPDGLFLDHLCRNRACVNPAHLEPVTNRENCLRGANSNFIGGKCSKCGSAERLWANVNKKRRQYRRSICAECHRIGNRAWSIVRRAKRDAAKAKYPPEGT